MTSRFRAVLAAIALLAVLPAPDRHEVTYAQGGQPPGRSIGTISTRGDLIVLELNEGALGTANMFDLEKRTVRFSPAARRLSGGDGRVAVGFGIRQRDEGSASVAQELRVPVFRKDVGRVFGRHNWIDCVLGSAAGGTTRRPFGRLRPGPRRWRGWRSARWRRRWWARRRRDHWPLRSAPGCRPHARQFPTRDLRLHEAAHVRHPAREGAVRPRRDHLEPERTGRRHPGLHVGPRPSTVFKLCSTKTARSRCRTSSSRRRTRLSAFIRS